MVCVLLMYHLCCGCHILFCVDGYYDLAGNTLHSFSVSEIEMCDRTIKNVASRLMKYGSLALL